MQRESVDWWYVAAVALIALVSIGDIIIPALLVGPVTKLSERLGDEEAEDAPLPAIALPSVAWPIGFAVLGLVVVGLATSRMLAERCIEGRWLWVLAAAGVTVLWSLGVIAALEKAEKALSQVAGSF